MKSLAAAARELVANGAVLQVWNGPKTIHLIGELQWLGPRRLFWFTAHGDRLGDGHVLEFEEAEIGEDAIEFLRNGRLIALLTDISTAGLEDPADYALAFSLWKEVAPGCRELINRSRRSLAESGLSRPETDWATGFYGQFD